MQGPHQAVWTRHQPCVSVSNGKLGQIKWCGIICSGPVSGQGLDPRVAQGLGTNPQRSQRSLTPGKGSWGVPNAVACATSTVCHSVSWSQRAQDGISALRGSIRNICSQALELLLAAVAQPFLAKVFVCMLCFSVLVLTQQQPVFILQHTLTIVLLGTATYTVLLPTQRPRAAWQCHAFTSVHCARRGVTSGV